MIPALFAIWALCAPMGYLAGDLFAERFTGDTSGLLPLLGALFPPVGAVLALLVILSAHTEDNQ